MKLPYVDSAYVPKAKITDYLLNPEHSRGKDKAAFFTRFGFTAEDWMEMQDALLTHARTHEVASTLDTDDGIHYAVEGELNTPDGRQPRVRTVWAIDEDSTAPRFITAYPLK